MAMYDGISGMYIFGGFPGGSDFDRFDLESWAWQPVAAVGHKPPGRLYAAGLLVDWKLLVWGGRDTTQPRYFGDLWQFEISTPTAQPMPVPAPTPGPSLEPTPGVVGIWIPG